MNVKYEKQCIKFSFQLAKVEVALCRVGDEIVALFTKRKLCLNV